MRGELRVEGDALALAHGAGRRRDFAGEDWRLNTGVPDQRDERGLIVALQNGERGGGAFDSHRRGDLSEPRMEGVITRRHDEGRRRGGLVEEADRAGPLKLDGARIHGCTTGKDAEEGRLAGTIGPDDGQAVASTQVKREANDEAPAPGRQGKSGNAQHTHLEGALPEAER